jgi:hypothetical protein
MTLTESRRNEEFILSEGSANYSRDNLPLGAEAGIKPPGTLLKLDTGVYVKHTVGATCTGILIDAVDTTSAIIGAVLTRHAQVKDDYLNWGSYTTAQQNAVKANLAAIGIIVR